MRWLLLVALIFVDDVTVVLGTFFCACVVSGEDDYRYDEQSRTQTRTRPRSLRARCVLSIYRCCC